jgi:hypothetical protein
VGNEMTVAELMDLLEDEEEDALVRIVHQQSWPLQEVVGGIAAGRDLFDEEAEDDENLATYAGSESAIVYLVANGHPDHGSPYGPRGAWDARRRRYR